MDFTGNDVATLMEWVRGPIAAHEHSLTFNFFAGPDNDFADRYKGTLAFEEGRAVAGGVGAPSPSIPVKVPHPTSSKLIGTGKTDKAEVIHVTLATDNLRKHPILVIKGDVNLGPLDGPFPRINASETVYDFTFSQGGTDYTFGIIKSSVDHSTFPKHSP